MTASKLLSLTIATLTIAASATSFAGTSNINELNYPGDAPFMSQATRADVQAAARGLRNLPGDLYGSDVRTTTDSSATREQVRKDAIEYTRSHKREISELA
jgi:hypothetical protein